MTVYDSEPAWLDAENPALKARFAVELRQLIEKHLGSELTSREHYRDGGAVWNVLEDEAKRLDNELDELHMTLCPVHAIMRKAWQAARKARWG